MLGQLLGSLAGGFAEESGKIRKENQDRAERSAEREQNLLLHLAASPDPEVQAAAWTGLLTKQPGKTGELEKWFGKQATSPVFSQVASMLGMAPGQGAKPVVPPHVGVQQPMGGGVGRGEQEATPGLTPPPVAQPVSAGPSRFFHSPAELEEAHAGAGIRGQINARVQAAKEGGFTLDQDALERIYAPGAQPRTQPNKAVTFFFTDGSSGGGFATPDGRYLDQNGDPMAWSGKTIARVSPSGALPSTTGAGGKNSRMTTMSAADYVAAYGPLPANLKGVQFVQVPRDPVTGAKAGEPAPINASLPASFQFPVDATGIRPANTRTGVVGPPQQFARPVEPQASATQIRADLASIRATARAEVGTIPGIGTSLDQQAFNAVLDREAKKLGWPTYDAMVAAAGEATRAVQGFVPSGPPPTAAPAPPKKPKAPAAKPATKATKPATTGDSVTDRWLEALGK